MQYFKNLFNSNEGDIISLIKKGEIKKITKFIKENDIDLQDDIKDFLTLAIDSNTNDFLNFLISNNLDFPKHIDNNNILSFAISKESNYDIIETIIKEDSLSKEYAYGLTPFEMALKVNAEFKLFSILIDNDILGHSESKLPIFHQILDNEDISDEVEGAIITYVLENKDFDLNQEIQSSNPLTIKAYEKEKYLLFYLFLFYGARVKDVADKYNELFDEEEKFVLSSAFLKNQPREDYEHFLPLLSHEDFKAFIESLESTKDMQMLILICKNTLLNIEGKIDLCKLALQKGCDINETSKDTEENTVLQYYCKNFLVGENMSFVDFLFENGAIFNFNNNTPITACVSGNEIDLIIYLVKQRGIDINELNKEGEGAINGFFDPIYLETNEDKITMLETLIDLGLDINQKVMGTDEDEYPNTSLIDLLLYDKSNHQLLEYLLHNHEEVIIENQISTMFEHEPSDNLCALMISKNPDYCDDSYFTVTRNEKTYYESARPIDLSIYHNRIELTDYLLDEYPNMQAYNEDYSIIHNAFYSDFPIEIIKKLIDRDSDLNREYLTRDPYDIMQKMTTLFRILDRANDENYEKSCEVIEYLLEKGANPNILVTKLDISDQYINQSGAVTYAMDKNCNTKLLDILIDKGGLDPKKPISNYNHSQIHAVLISRDLEDEQKLFYLKYFHEKCILDLEQKNREGYNLFLSSVSNCLAKCVEYLIQLGSNQHIIGGADNSPAIHKAISNFHFVDKTKRADTVQVLIDAGVDLEQFDSEQLTPLMSAVKYGCFESVLKLLEHGVNVNNKNEVGCNAANVFITNDFANTEHKYSYDDKENIEENKSKILAVLKDYGCDLDNVPQEGSTVLCNAIGYNFKTIFNTLLQLEVDVNKQDTRGNTALMTAIQFGDISIVNTLLQHPAIKLDVEDNNGENLIHKAIRRENDEKMLDLIGYLMDNKVPVKKLENGMNLLVFASYFCHYRLYEGLLTLVGDIEEKDNYGLNALFWTIQSNLQIPEQERMISINKLIELGANVKEVDSNGRNLLHWAVISHFQLTFDMLFERQGLDINHKDKEGLTPICYFISNYFDKAYEGYEDFFESYISKVVKHGANVEDAITATKVIDENAQIINFLESLK